VKKGANPVSGVKVDLSSVNGQLIQYVSSVTTDTNGNFDLGVYGGQWEIIVDNQDAASNNLVSPSLGFTVTDGNNITGITLAVVDGTGTISGVVRDTSGNPVTNASVWGNATIASVLYNVGAQTDSGGNYSFPVIDGSWALSAGANGLNFNTKVVNVSGSAVVNFFASVISLQPINQNTSTNGQVTFNISTNTPGANTVRWQVSTNHGGAWTDLTEGTPYTGTTSNSLTINPAANAMNGNWYRCVVTWNSGANFENSLPGTLTVNAVAPNFTSQPSPQTVPAGTTATFTAGVNDGAATFQWQESADGGTTWNNVTNSATYGGATTATLTITNPSQSLNGHLFRLVATDVQSNNSNSVTLIVHAAVADFNGDGKMDVIWTNTSTGDRAIWYLNGTAIGTFDYLAYVPTNWSIVGQADFNGDGKTDLVWENTIGDRSVWLMNGTTIIDYPYLAWVDPAWHIAAIGDFDGNGKPDLIWENAGSGGVDRAIWYLNGINIMSFDYIAGIPSEWRIVGAADFDGDGHPDLVWENVSTGQRSIWLMNGLAINSFGDLGVVGTAWHIAEVGDFDGDGHPDLLWENTTTGDRAIWIMNGTSHTSSVYLAFVDPLWRIAP